MIDLVKKLAMTAGKAIGIIDRRYKPTYELENHYAGKGDKDNIKLERVNTYDPILEIVKETLPSEEGNYRKYTNIEKFKEGGTRTIYKANWGPGNKKVVIKVDKTPLAPNAIRHVNNGYTTEKELQVATKIKNPDENNVIGLTDYYHSPKLKELGYSGFITVEPLFEGENLEEYVRNNGTLGRDEIKSLFRDILQAENYLVNEENLLHRDANLGNILVKKNGRLRGALTDLTNAGKKLKLEKKVLPTSGSRLLVDPTKFQPFGGEMGYYGEDSEARAIAVDMYFATTGIKPFYFDADNGIATNLFTGESMLDENSRLDLKKYNKCLDTALEYVDGDNHRLRKVLAKGLSIDETKRYSTIKELSDDFEKAVKPTKGEAFAEFCSKNAGKVIAMGTALVLVTVFGLVEISSLSDRANFSAAKATRESKEQVFGRFKGDPAEVHSSIAEIKPRVNINASYEEGMVFPASDYLVVKPKDMLNVTVLSREKELKDIEGKTINSPRLSGKAYIEGYPGKKFSIYPDACTEQNYYGEMGGRNWSNSPLVEVPEDIIPGNHVLVVETYANKNFDKSLEKSGYSRSYGEENFFYRNPDSLIDRRRIPIVVGDVNKKIDVGTLNMTCEGTGITLKDMDDKMLWGELYGSPRNVSVFASIPELSTESKKGRWKLDLPETKDTTKIYTLQLEYKDSETGEHLGHTWFPVKSKDVYGDGTYEWFHALPDTNWSNRLIMYGDALSGDSTKLNTVRELANRYHDASARADSVLKKARKVASSNLYYYASEENRENMQRLEDSVNVGIREIEKEILATGFFPHMYEGINLDSLKHRNSKEGLREAELAREVEKQKVDYTHKSPRTRSSGEAYFNSFIKDDIIDSAKDAWFYEDSGYVRYATSDEVAQTKPKKKIPKSIRGNAFFKEKVKPRMHSHNSPALKQKRFRMPKRKGFRG